MHIAAQRHLPAAIQTSSWVKHDPGLYNTYLRDNMKTHCRNCLGYGHYEKQCPLLSDNQTGRTQTSNLQSSDDGTNQNNINTRSQFRNGQQRSSSRLSNSTNLITINRSANPTRDYCFRFNNDDPCRLPCDWPHLCYQCHKPDHPFIRCTKNNNNNNSNNNTTTTRFRP